MSSDAGIGTFWQRLVLVSSRAAGTSIILVVNMIIQIKIILINIPTGCNRQHIRTAKPYNLFHRSMYIKISSNILRY